MSPVIVAFVLTVLALLFDSPPGARSASIACQAHIQLSGFRYYGIGNE